MDALDEKIISMLVADARTPLAQVAKQVGAATATVHQRVRRLQDRGIIRGTRVMVDWDAVGLPLVAMISLQVGASHRLPDVAAALADLPYLQGCFAVTGEFDLLVIARARSADHLGEILDEMRAIAKGATRTTVVLTTFFEGRVPPLPTPRQDS